MSPHLNKIKDAIQEIAVLENVTAKVTPLSCPDGVAIKLDIIWGKGNRPDFCQLMVEIAAEFENRFKTVRDQLLSDADGIASALIDDAYTGGAYSHLLSAYHGDDAVERN